MGKYLNRNSSSELRVLSQENLSHATAAEPAHDAIVAKRAPDEVALVHFIHEPRAALVSRRIQSNCRRSRAIRISDSTSRRNSVVIRTRAIEEGTPLRPLALDGRVKDARDALLAIRTHLDIANCRFAVASLKCKSELVLLRRSRTTGAQPSRLLRSGATIASEDACAPVRFAVGFKEQV